MADAQSQEDESPAVAPSRRFGRSVPVPSAVVRRFAPNRFWRIAAAGVILGGVLIAGGASLSRSVVAWLKKRPEYAFSLDQIRFDPVPPPWLKGGRDRLLDPLRAFAKTQPSALDLDPGWVHTRMGTSPWVRRVDRVELGYPNEVRVRLEYRVPVARVNGTGKPRPVLLDADGVVLPDDVDLAAFGPLISLEIKHGPPELTEGLAWPAADHGERMVAFAKLAAFLSERARAQPEVLPKVDQVSLYPDHPKGVWLELGTGNFLLWGADPAPSDGEPSNDQKWETLREHSAKSGQLKLVPGHHYLFRKDRIVSVPTPS